jgi:type II secretory pathway pseudopilin PulG
MFHGRKELNVIVMEMIEMEKGRAKMNRTPNFRCQGITLIEILMVLGLLMILGSFALPSMSSATVRADMRAASENLQHSIQIARNTARMAESGVSMNLSDGAGETGKYITFSVSELAIKRLGQPGIPEYRLNDEIKLVSDFPSYEFDARGIVKNPGRITLVSNADESVSFQVMVE